MGPSKSKIYIFHARIHHLPESVLKLNILVCAPMLRNQLKLKEKFTKKKKRKTETGMKAHFGNWTIAGISFVYFFSFIYFLSI